MSGTREQEEEDENAILLDESFDGENPQKQSIPPINADDEEMLLLSSSPSPSLSLDDSLNSLKETAASTSTSLHLEAGPSGLLPKLSSTPLVKPPPSSSSAVVVASSKTGTSSNSNIIIEDSSDSVQEMLEGEEEDSIEVIGSEDEEEEEDEEMYDENSEESDENLSALLDGKVQIFMAQGSFFIWNAEDAQMLREECRIVGKLVGCLPRAPRQNSHLGLPLQLMPEEAKLLEEIEAACVVQEVESIPEDIKLLRQTSFQAMREDNFQAQQNMYRESRKEEIRQIKHKIVAGQKAKKRKIQELENGHNITSSSPSSSSLSSKVTKTMPTISESDSETKEMADSWKGGGDKGEEADGREREEGDKQTTDSVIAASRKLQSETSADSESKPTKSVDAEKKETDTGDVCETNTGGVDQQTPTKGKTDGSKENEGDGEKKEKGDGGMVALEKEVDDDDNDEDNDDDLDVEGLIMEATDVKHSLVQLFTENPWKETVTRPKHWIFPLSQKEFLRYEVFRDLWKKGYCLTSGSKFGGDFLVYPGDPSRFHSHFIAVCIDKTVDLSALDIVSLGRQGSNVRKSVLLCAFNQSKQVVYTSLQWTGIS